MNEPTPIIVRTSDRINFKKCRRAWNWSSKLRGNLEPFSLPKPLEFGTAIHAALEVYYDPETWEWLKDDRASVVHGLTLQAFHDAQKKQVNRYLKLVGQEALPEEMAIDFKERTDLGIGMLEHYFMWAPTADNFTPRYVEVEFEVPIPGTEHLYQGRIDLLLEDSEGYWIFDHKTASPMTRSEFFGDVTHLELDEQCGSYAWAIQEQLGVKIQGVIYSELFKSVPAPPERLVRGGFSKNKQQPTTFELYKKALLEEYGSVPESYLEFLAYLKHQENKFFRRTRIHRSPIELKNLGEQIAMEAMDMADPNLRIYPNPNRNHCKWCMFRTPCLGLNDGSDVDWLLQEAYVSRDQEDQK